MLQELRNPRVFKWVMWAVLIVTIPSFVLFYGFSDNASGRPEVISGPLLTVETSEGETEMSARDLEQARDHLLRYYVRMAEMAGFPQEQLPSVAAAANRELSWHTVAEHAIGNLALTTEMNRQDIRVTDKQVSERLARDGMTRDELARMLEARRMSEYEFAQEIKSGLREEMAGLTISRAARTSLLELWQEYSLYNERLTVTAVEVAVPDRATFEPTDEQIAEEYRKLVDAKDRSVIQGKQKVYQYIRIPAPPRGAPTATDEQLMAEYEATPADDPAVRQEPGIQVRHLLVATSPAWTPEQNEAARQRALTAHDRIEGGEDFAAVANEVSEDNRNRKFSDAAAPPELLGGLLPNLLTGKEAPLWGDEWVRHITNAPVGELSPVIATPQGYSIARVEDRPTGGKAPFAAVREALRPRVEARLKADADHIRDAAIAENLARLRDAAATETTINGMSRMLNADIRTTSPTLATSYFIPGIGNLNQEKEAMDELGDRGMSPVLQTSAGDAVVLRVSGIIEEAPRPLEQVAPTLRSRVQGRLASEQAAAAAEALKLQAQTGDNFTSEALRLGHTLVPVAPFMRAEPPTELSRATELQQRLLPANQGEVLVGPVGPDDFRTSYLVVRIDAVETPSVQNFFTEIRDYEQRLLTAKRLAYIDEFRRDAVAALPAEYNDQFFNRPEE